MSYENSANLDAIIHELTYGARGDHSGPSNSASRRGNGITPPAVMATPAEVLAFPGVDPWWTRAPGAPPFVHAARKRYAEEAAQLSSLGLVLDQPGYVTVNYSNTGPLSKRFEAIADVNGNLSLPPPETAASLYNGSGHKVPFDRLSCLMQLREEADENTCFSYGVYAFDDVHIRTEKMAARYGGCPLVAARDGEHLEYSKGPGAAPFDFDFYGEALRPEDAHELASTLVTWWGDADVLWDFSCSSGIEHEPSGQLLKPLGNCRALMMIDDASKGPALIKELYVKLWGAGYGGHILAKNARLLPRALVDTSMGQPERFDFSKPFLVGDLRRADRRGFPKIFQGKERRLATVGKGLDIDLSEFHRNSPDVQKSLAAMREGQEALKARLIDEAGDKALAEGRDGTAARKRAERLCGGVEGEPVYLVDEDELFMQDGSIMTVAEVRRDPAKFDRARCADPLEPTYRNDMRIAQLRLIGMDIGPHIYSHAHGRQVCMLPRSPADFGLDKVKLPATPPAVVLPAPAGVVKNLDFLTDEDEKALPSGFRYAATDDGFIMHIEYEAPPKKEDDEPRWYYLCSPIKFRAVTSNAEGEGWGLSIMLRDPNSQWRPATIRQAETVEANGLLKRLVDLGLTCFARQKLMGLLTFAPRKISARACSAPHVGWQERPDGRPVFVLPDRTIGAADSEVVYQPDTVVKTAYGTRGTLEGWQERHSQACDRQLPTAFQPIRGLLWAAPQTAKNRRRRL